MEDETKGRDGCSLANKDEKSPCHKSSDAWNVSMTFMASEAFGSRWRADRVSEAIGPETEFRWKANSLEYEREVQ